MAAFRPPRPTIDVAVAILRDAAGRVLVAERLPRQLSAGYWELPGGKVDAGETAAQAAVREAAEELGVRIDAVRPFTHYTHDFPLRRLRLSFFIAERWHGQPHGREGQKVAWVEPHLPRVAPVLPSNRRALALLGLPDEARYGCPEALSAPTETTRQLWIVDTRGAHSAQRLHWLTQATRQRQRLGLPTLVADDVHQAVRAGADGVCSGDVSPAVWPQRPAVGLWSVFCHDAAAAHRCVDLGADIGIFDPAATAADPGMHAALRRFAAVYQIEPAIAAHARHASDAPRRPTLWLRRWRGAPAV